MASSFSKLQTRTTSFQASQIACLVFSLRTNQRETLTTDNQLNFSEKEPRHEQLITGSWVKHKLKKDKKQKKTNPQNTQKRKEGVQSHSVRSIPLLSAITETVQNQFAEWNRADVRWDGCRTKAFLFFCVWRNWIRVWNIEITDGQWSGSRSFYGKIFAVRPFAWRPVMRRFPLCC